MLANKKVFKKMYSTAREEERVRFQTKAGQADTYPPSNQQENINPLLPLVKLWTTQKVPSQWVYNFAKLTSNWSCYQN